MVFTDAYAHPRTALHTELFPSLLSYERVFSGIVDSLVHKNFLRASPQTIIKKMCISRCVYAWYFGISIVLASTGIGQLGILVPQVPPISN